MIIFEKYSNVNISLGELEMDWRIALDLVFICTVSSMDNPNTNQDLQSNNLFTFFLNSNNLDSIIESVLLKAIHLSLDVAFVPIKKLVMLFHLYLQLFFGNVGKK